MENCNGVQTGRCTVRIILNKMMNVRWKLHAIFERLTETTCIPFLFTTIRSRTAREEGKDIGRTIDARVDSWSSERLISSEALQEMLANKRH